MILECIILQNIAKCVGFNQLVRMDSCILNVSCFFTLCFLPALQYVDVFGAYVTDCKRKTVRARGLTFHRLSELLPVLKCLVRRRHRVGGGAGEFRSGVIPKGRRGCCQFTCPVLPASLNIRIVFCPRTLNTGFTTEWNGEGIKGTSL